MQSDSILLHLQNLVALHPKTSDQNAVLNALQYCQNVLRATGSFDDLKFHRNEGYHSLTASTQGTKKPKLLLQAHIDVVPSSDNPTCETQINQNTVCGRGVYDMLFAVASYLVFAQKHADKLDDLDIGLMLTGDEEIGGFNGTAHLLDKGYSGDVCFLPDSGEDFGDLSISAKGAYNFDLVANGVSHHGSRPWEGDGAANKLIHMIHELMDIFDHSDQNNSTITVTRFSGGGSINKGPSEACAHLDIRFKDTTDLKRIQAEVERVCHKYDGEVRNLLQADDLMIDTSSQYIQDFLTLYEKHAGKPITQSKAHGGSDARFFAKNGVPVIMIRPDGKGAHGDDETLSLDSLDKFYDLLEEFSLKTAKIK